MANFLETIKVLIDIDSSKAASGLKGVHAEVDKAETKFGKLKASSGGIFDKLGITGPMAMATVGTAVGVFAVKAIGDFQNLALSVDKFTQKTGVSANEASRWVEVGNDLGISADTVATAFGKFERADTAGTLTKYGLSATDASGRFAELLGKIGAIPDEGDRAAAAFKVFGKSWQELAPLLDSTEDLNKRLKEVPKGKLISDSQIADARAFRDAMDDLNDRLQGLIVQIGGALVPALTSLADSLGMVADAFGGVAGAFDSLPGPMKTFISDTAKIVSGFGYMSTVGQTAGDALGAVGDAIFSSGDAAVTVHSDIAQLGSSLHAAGVDTGKLTANSLELTDAQKAATAVLADQAKRWADLAASERDAAKAGQEQIDAQRAAADAFVAVGQASDEYTTFLAGLNKETADAKGNQEKLNDINREAIDKSTSLADAVGRVADEQATAAGTTQTATGKLDSWNTSMLGSASHLSGPLLEAVLGYIGSVNQIPPEKLTEIQALIEQGKLDEAKAKLDEASKARKVAMTADANTTQAEKDLNYTARDRDMTIRVHSVGGAPVEVHAGGGDVKSGLAWVGELGPELVALPVGSHVFTALQSMAMKVPHFAAGGDLNSPEAISSMTAHNLFASGGKYGGQSTDDLFNYGADFYDWWALSGPYKGSRLGKMFSRGADFYNPDPNVLFGTGADFANLLVGPVMTISGRPAGPGGYIGGPAYTPDQMVGGGVSMFGGISVPTRAAYGVSYMQPSVGTSSGPNRYSDESGATSWTVPVKGGLSAPGPGAGLGGFGSSAPSVTYNVTVNTPPFTDPVTLGRVIVENIKNYERASGPGWRTGISTH